MEKDHFPLEEFRCHDGSAYPTEWVETRLPALKLTLERIRHYIGDRPTRVLCGYRSPSWNLHLRQKGLQGEEAATGVAEHSQHPEGRAADITVHGMTTKELHDTVLEMHAKGLLPELGGVGYYPNHGFVHVDTYRLATGHLRRWNG